MFFLVYWHVSDVSTTIARVFLVAGELQCYRTDVRMKDGGENT